VKREERNVDSGPLDRRPKIRTHSITEADADHLMAERRERLGDRMTSAQRRVPVATLRERWTG
jgi:hypothetical protein